MEESSYKEIVKQQTGKALWSIRNVISCVSNDKWNSLYCEMPLWKHIYHTIHSLDKWYINPTSYKEPFFHENNLNNLNVVTLKVLSRSDIDKYLVSVIEKIETYMDNLKTEDLLEKPENCEWNRFTLIMAQLRHLHYHTGIIMGFIIVDSGKWPLVMGLENDIPDDRGFSLYE